MSYEAAPATRLLATHCAACSRPLVDAVSVEAGMGPECRRKYGREPELPPDYDAAMRSLDSLQHTAAECPTSWHDLAPRDFANRLVHRVASHAAERGELSERTVLCAAIAALGFPVLAAKLLENSTEVIVISHDEDGALVIDAPFCPAFNANVRRVPGQRWDGARKVRTVPVSSRSHLWHAIKSSFPVGTAVRSARGIVSL